MRDYLIFAFIFFTIFSSGQDQTTPLKIGYADIDYIYGHLPAAKQVESELKSLQAQLENQLKTKYVEFKTKYDYHAQRESSMTKTELINAQKELQLLQENIQKFERECEATFQHKQKQLMEPVSQSIQKAIADVAHENNYMFILNAGAGQRDLVLHADRTADVSDLILRKLGITSAN